MANTPSNNIKAALQEEAVAAKPVFIQVGMPVETTVPTVGTDGQIKRPWHASYGEYVMAGYDVSLGALTINDPSPAIQAKWGPVAHAQLTAAGSTPEVNVRPYSTISFKIIIATIDTSVTVRAEGSHTAVAGTWFNLDDAGIDTTYLANGAYELSKYGCSINYVRFTFVSEAGGANATIDVSFMAGC